MTYWVSWNATDPSPVVERLLVVQFSVSIGATGYITYRATVFADSEQEIRDRLDEAGIRDVTIEAAP